MHAMAQVLVQASEEARGTTLTPRALRRLLFLRFYGQDFDPETCKKILKSFEKLDDKGEHDKVATHE